MNNLTLEDIAQRSGVSRSTVSRVINDHPNVSKKVRTRVKEIINKTGYQPHAAARALVSKRSWTCGLILPRTINSFFTDPYYPCLIQGIAQECSKQNYTFSLFLMGDEEDEDKMFRRISRRGFMDGILFQSDQIGDSLIDRLVRSEIPLVVLGRPIHNGKISFVDVNNIESVENAVEYLISLGNKKIGTITGPLNTTVGIDRKKGFENAIKKHGMDCNDSLITEGNFTEASGYEGMRKLLKSKPDAVFTASDQMALGAIRAIKEVGLKVPEDISIIGYDDFPLPFPSKPALSTIRQPIGNFGSEAIKVLIDIIENGLEPARNIILKSELVIRESTIQR